MKRYDSYKDSGVEWLGSIPSHWRKSKFKFVSDLYTGNSLNDSQKLQYESENSDDIPYVSSKDIDVEFQTVNYNNGLRIPRINNPLKISPKGSFLMVVEGGSSGRKKVYLEQDVCFVNKLCSFNSRENTKFQYYFIQSSNYQDKFKLSMSGLIGSVSISNLKDFELTLPPLSEQEQIVSFLDTKTSLIDSLIEKTQRKIELLKEKRTSLINEVVTKGLNPNVEMKDSGVEWIGEIPRDWKSKRFSYSINIQKGKIPKNLTDEQLVDSLPYLSMGVLRGDEPLEFSNESGVVQVSKGDIGLLWDGSNSGEVIKINREGILSSTVSLLSLKDNTLDKEFSFYLLKFYEKDFRENTIGMGIPHVSGDHVRESKLIIPPLPEQQQIVEYLDEQTQLIDNTISIEEKRIELLKEYRQSLISEVVTGKLKVTEDE